MRIHENNAFIMDTFDNCDDGLNYTEKQMEDDGNCDGDHFFLSNIISE